MANELISEKKEISQIVEDRVTQMVEQGTLHLPPNYSAGNAMRSAWLQLQEIKDKNKQPALDVITKDSLANALLSMTVQGLNPEKKQGYFIVYGNSLQFQRSYFGTMAVTKRITGAKEIVGQVIYEDDNVEYEMVHGKIKNLSHKQKFGNIEKKKIVGAYATIIMPDDTEIYTEVMTYEEIVQAWKMSKTWYSGDEPKAGSVHDKFTQEMAKKTVINRACKKFINSSNDESVLSDYFNKESDEIKEAETFEIINDEANSEDFEEDVTHEYEDGDFSEIDGEDAVIPVSPTESEDDPF